jgi:hypothetical protein
MIMFNRILCLAGAAMLLGVSAAWAGPSVQGKAEKKVEAPVEAKIAPELSHSASRLKFICSKLGLAKGQMDGVEGLWKEFSGKFMYIHSNAGLKPAKKEEHFKTLQENYDRRFRNLLTRPQQNLLNDLFEKAAKEAKAVPVKVKDGPQAAKKICWSCWPGKCDLLVPTGK